MARNAERQVRRRQGGGNRCGRRHQDLRDDELVAHGKTVYEGWVAVRAVINRPAKGVPGTFPALDGSKIVNGGKEWADCNPSQRQTGTAKWLRSSI